MKHARIIVVIFFLVVVGALGVATARHNRDVSSANGNKLAADTMLLNNLWQTYKQQYLDSASGRTMDRQTNNITTSEGQGYTMLRAVWMNDRSTFDRTWLWTSTQLQRSDKLFAWKWGAKPDGSDGILADQGGQNSASDADTDIALALLMAAAKWPNNDYGMKAHDVIEAIWDNEVITIQGKPYLAANNVEKSINSPTIVVNPSYFAPYAYRIFAQVDNNHDWQALITSSYDVINRASQARLDANHSGGLPPNWVLVNRTNGQLSASPDPNQTTDFGFDAFRTIWRIALDWQWFQADMARKSLSQFGSLQTDWQQTGKLVAIYGHDGKPKANYTSLAIYGGTLGYFKSEHTGTANIIYKTQLQSLSTAMPPKISGLSYYDNNWVWFGAALYLNKLPNVAITQGAI